MNKQTSSCNKLQKFVYVDSSEEEPETNNEVNHGKITRECRTDCQLHNDYEFKLKKIVKNQI